MIRDGHARLFPAAEERHIMGMPATHDTVTTIEALLALPDDSPEKPIRRWSDVGVPLLAIEVLSPGTAARDRGAKRRIYQRAGVGEDWIVDLDARIIERWTPEDARPEVLNETLPWSLPGGASGEIDLPAFYRRVSGD